MDFATALKSFSNLKFGEKGDKNIIHQMMQLLICI